PDGEAHQPVRTPGSAAKEPRGGVGRLRAARAERERREQVITSDVEPERRANSGNHRWQPSGAIAAESTKAAQSERRRRGAARVWESAVRSESEERVSMIGSFVVCPEARRLRATRVPVRRRTKNSAFSPMLTGHWLAEVGHWPASGATPSW